MKRLVQIMTAVALILAFVLSGCQKPLEAVSDDTFKIYFFDETRNILSPEPIGDEFNKIQSPQEKVEYIIARLVENKSVQLAKLQSGTKIPYQRTNMSENLTEDPTVKFHFTAAYNELSPIEKIGIRASIVYSLCELDFINGVEFYVEDMPLMTSTGKTVGVIHPSQIKMDVLDPNPATTPYTLSLYYSDGHGKLKKEVRGVVVSESASVEKLLIEELINGPSIEGLKATMPNDVKINEVNVAMGVCRVDLSFNTKSKFFTSDLQRELMIYSMVDSLTELPQIKKVVIFLDGKSNITFTHDIEFGDTLERKENYISEE